MSIIKSCFQLSCSSEGYVTKKKKKKREETNRRHFCNNVKWLKIPKAELILEADVVCSLGRQVCGSNAPCCASTFTLTAAFALCFELSLQLLFVSTCLVSCASNQRHCKTRLKYSNFETVVSVNTLFFLLHLHWFTENISRK